MSENTVYDITHKNFKIHFLSILQKMGTSHLEGAQVKNIDYNDV